MKSGAHCRLNSACLVDIDYRFQRGVVRFCFKSSKLCVRGLGVWEHPGIEGQFLTCALQESATPLSCFCNSENGSISLSLRSTTFLQPLFIVLTRCMLRCACR